MQSQDPHHLLVQIARILDHLKIPYFITGGISVLVWGRPRFTADIDLVVEMTLDDIAKLSEALHLLSPEGYIDTDMMKDALNTHGEFNFIESNTGIKVDFWILSNSEFDQSRLRRRVAKEILGAPVYFTSAEDLILIKLKWYKESESDRQRADVESILKITKNIDYEYLQKMARKLDLGEILEKIIASMPD